MKRFTRSKRMLCLALAMLLLAGLLAACQSGGDGGGTDDGTPGGGTVADGNPVYDPELYPLPEVLKTSGANWGWATSDPEKDQVIGEINKQFGTTVQADNIMFGSYDEVIQKMQLWASTDMKDWPNIWVTGTDNQVKDIVNRMGRAGKLVDWMPFLESMPELYESFKILIPTVITDDGALYGLPIQYTNIDTNPCYAKDISVSIRHDWLEQLNLPYPKTMDELYDTLVAFRDDITLEDGSSVVPIALFSDSFLELLYYFYPNYQDTWYWDEAAQQAVFPNMEQPEYLINGLKWHNKLYREGLIAKEAFTMKTSQMDEMINQGRVGAVKQSSWAVGTYNNVLGDDKAFVLTGVLYDDNTNSEPAKQLAACAPYNLVTAKTDAPMEEIYGYLKYAEYMASKEGTLLAYYGIEGVHWEYDENGDVKDTPECAERLKGDWSLRAEEGIGLYGAEWNYDVLAETNAELDIDTMTGAEWLKQSYVNQGFITYQGYTADPNYYLTAGDVEMKWLVGYADRYNQMIIQAVSAENPDDIDGIVETWRQAEYGRGYEDVKAERTAACLAYDLSLLPDPKY